MDVKALFKYFLRRKWVIIGVTLLCMVIVYLLVREMPQQYRSQAQIATGLTDASQQTSEGAKELDYFRVSTQFDNIIEMITTRRVISLLTNKLIVHDLSNEEESFEPWTDEVKRLGDEKRGQAIALLQEKIDRREPVTIVENTPELPLYNAIESMGYDERNLRKYLTVERSGESDFINISYSSKNPALSSFVVNTLTNDFVVYYTLNTTSNQRRSLALLDSVMRQKELVMNQKNAQLRNYKAGSGVVNLDKQSEVLYQQISANETKRGETISQIQSLQGALSDINRRLSEDAAGRGNSMADNNEIVNLENQIQLANQRYINNNFRKADKAAVDSLSRLRAAKLAHSADKYSTNPLTLKQGLNDQKMRLETDLALAQSSMASIETELTELRSRYNAMVPTDAGVQNLQRDAELATKEYMDALNRYNQTTVEKNTTVRLQITEEGMPGAPEPSKKWLYVGLSGFAGLSLCLSFFTLLFITDNKIRNADALARATEQKVIGSLNYVRESNKDLRDIWEDDHTVFDYTVYKDLLRSIRFEIDSELKRQEKKAIGIVSLTDSTGKTFIASSLAYAFAMTGRRVLLICDDAPNLLSVVSNKEADSNQNFESFLVKKEIKVEDLITVLNKNPNNNSLLEMKDSNSLLSGFEYLKDNFDVILIDIGNLKELNKAKEWLMFSDLSLAIFETGKTLSDDDQKALRFLKNQENFMGWVINKVKVDARA